MDGMVDIPDTDLDAIYVETARLLSEEWALIQTVKGVHLRHRLTVAHGRLHHYLAGQAAARGIPLGPVVMSGGGGKPPNPA